MKKSFIISFVIVMLFLGACGGNSTTSPTSTSTTTTTTTTASTPAKTIALEDSPDVLNLLPSLPDNFQKIDPASEGLSNKDMGLGDLFGEVEAVFSEEPYQLIYGFLSIIDSKIEQSAAEAIFKNEAQLKDLITDSLTSGMNEADVDISGIQTQISYPDVADFAVAGEGKFSTSGVNASFDFFWFRSGKVFVYIYSLSLSNEKQTLEPLAREVLNKLNTYSQ